MSRRGLILASLLLSAFLISLDITIVTVAFFSLAGIFLITQYFQFLKGYSPFGAGLRTLPVATVVAVSSVLGTRLAVRFGILEPSVEQAPALQTVSAVG